MSKAIDEIKRSENVTSPLSPHLPIRFSSATSSLSPTPKIDRSTPSIKPTLSPPINKTLQLYVEKLEPTFTKYTDVQQKGLESLLEKIRSLQHREAEQINTVEKAKQDVTFWSMISDLGSVVTSAFSIYFGAAAVSAGAAPVGGAMIASGVLSIGNLAFKYGGVWNYMADQVAEKNTQLHNTFTSYIPTAIGLTSAAVGAYGSYYTWRYATETGVKQAIAILGNIGSVTTGLAHFATGMTQGSLSFAKQELSFLRSNSHFTTMDFENLSQDIREYIEKQLQLNKTLSQIVKETESLIQVIQQPI